MKSSAPQLHQPHFKCSESACLLGCSTLGHALHGGTFQWTVHDMGDANSHLATASTPWYRAEHN